MILTRLRGMVISVTALVTAVVMIAVAGIITGMFRLAEGDRNKQSTAPELVSEHKPRGRVAVASEWVEKEDVLLDIGCNDGLFLAHAALMCRSARGIDIDGELLEHARASFTDIEFERASAERLPFSDASFSAISMLDVLEHLPDPPAALREVDRVLCPGGKLIISVPHRGLFGFVDAQRSSIFAAGRRIRLGKTDEILEHRHFLLYEVSNLLGPGYAVQRLHYGGLLVFPLCGYVLMLTDSLGLKRVSEALRAVEDKDFRHDYGTRSWHVMAEYRKIGGEILPSFHAPVALKTSIAKKSRVQALATMLVGSRRSRKA